MNKNIWIVTVKYKGEGHYQDTVWEDTNIVTMPREMDRRDSIQIISEWIKSFFAIPEEQMISTNMYRIDEYPQFALDAKGNRLDYPL